MKASKTRHLTKSSHHKIGRRAVSREGIRASQLHKRKERRQPGGFTAELYGEQDRKGKMCRLGNVEKFYCCTQKDRSRDDSKY